MSAEIRAQVQTIRNVNDSLFQASIDGNLEEVEKYMSHPDALLGTTVQKAAMVGNMQVVEMLIQNGVEKRFVFDAMLCLLDRPSCDVEIFAKIFNSKFWDKTSDNLMRLSNWIIHRDNLEIFKLFDMNFLKNPHQNAVCAAKNFSVKILSHILDNYVFNDEQLDDQFDEFIEALCYGYLATHKLAFSTPRGKYAKHCGCEQEKIATANEPIYTQLMKKLANLANLSEADVNQKLNIAIQRAIEKIKKKNQELKEQCWA